MSQNEITKLDQAIKKLGQRWDDLDALSIKTTSFAKKLELLDYMDLINIRIGWLETIRNHLRAAVVTVDPPTPADTKQIKDVLAVLSTKIAAEMKAAAAITLTKRVLQAARTLKTNLDGRQNRVT